MPTRARPAASARRALPALALLAASLAAAGAAAAALEGAVPGAAASASAAAPSSRADLYVPSHVRAGIEYYGMVRHEGPRPGPGGAMDVRLAADPSAIRMDRAVRLQAGADHAIFAFTAIERGQHAIRASAGGEFAEAVVTAHGGGGGPGPAGRGLAVTLPPSTRTAHVTGAVHLVDGRGAAVAGSDVAVSMSGGAGVLVPREVVIPRGSTGALFDAFVTAPGTVHAYSGEMRAEAHIGHERGEPAAVRVRVWPPVLPENAAGHYFVWFEGDGGGPAVPPLPLAALLHASDPRVARIGAALPPGGGPGAAAGAAPGAAADRPLAVQLTGVPWHGTFRTGGAGAASLTVAVPGHGTDTDWFVVGPAAYGAPEPVHDNGTVLRGAPEGLPGGGGAGGPRAARGAAEAAEAAPNLVISDVIPPVAASVPAPGRAAAAAGPSYVVAAAYRAAYSDRTVEIGDAGAGAPGRAGRVQMAGEVSSLRPSVRGPVEIVIASDGADHAATAVLGAPVRGGGAGPAPSNSAVVPIRSDAGLYEVSVTAPGMRAHPRAVQFEAAGAQGGAGARLHILPLPVVPARMQDIALVYAGDEDGAVLEPSAAIGLGGGGSGGRPAAPPSVILEAGGGASLPAGFVTMDAPVVRVRGLPGPGGGGSLTAWSPPASPAAARLGAQFAAAFGGEPGAPPAGGEPGAVDAPGDVRAHEVFPASVLPRASAAGAADGAAAPRIDASGGCRPAGAAEASAALAASRPADAQDEGGAPGAPFVSPSAAAPDARSGSGSGSAPSFAPAAPSFAPAAPSFAPAAPDGRNGSTAPSPSPSPAPDARSGSGLFVCGLAGRLSVFSDTGHSSVGITPYARNESASIEAGFGGTVRAGGEYRIDVRFPAAPPAAPPPSVAVDSAVPYEIVDGGRAVVLRPDRAGRFPVTVAADAPGGAPSSARFDIDVDASVPYSVRAVDMSGASLAVPVTVSAAPGGEARAAVTPYGDRAEQGQGVTVVFPRSALHGDRAYELVAAGIDPAPGGGGGRAAEAAGGAAGGGPPAGGPPAGEKAARAAPTAVTAAPRDGDSFSATYARVVLVQVAGGAEGGGAFREGHEVAVSAPDVHVASFLIRSVWDGWSVRAAGQAAEPGIVAAADALSRDLNGQGPYAAFAAAEDVVVTALYREDHTGAAIAFAAAGMIAVLAVFRGGAAYALRAVQMLDSAEAAWRGICAAAAAGLFSRKRAGRHGGGSGSRDAGRGAGGEFEDGGRGRGRGAGGEFEDGGRGRGRGAGGEFEDGGRGRGRGAGGEFEDGGRGRSRDGGRGAGGEFEDGRGRSRDGGRGASAGEPAAGQDFAAAVGSHGLHDDYSSGEWAQAALGTDGELGYSDDSTCRMDYSDGDIACGGPGTVQHVAASKGHAAGTAAGKRGGMPTAAVSVASERIPPPNTFARQYASGEPAAGVAAGPTAAAPADPAAAGGPSLDTASADAAAPADPDAAAALDAPADPAAAGGPSLGTASAAAAAPADPDAAAALDAPADPAATGGPSLDTASAAAAAPADPAAGGPSLDTASADAAAPADPDAAAADPDAAAAALDAAAADAAADAVAMSLPPHTPAKMRRAAAAALSPGGGAMPGKGAPPPAGGGP